MIRINVSSQPSGCGILDDESKRGRLAVVLLSSPAFQEAVPMKRIHIVLLPGLISLVVLAQPCVADIPETITLQGALESPSGGPLTGQHPYRV
jgi:hypothetical protein